MNKTTEALKLAEEALGNLWYQEKAEKALVAIREALVEQAPIQSWFGIGAAWPEKQEMISAAYGLSSWLSAALDDPKVCQEYKDAINAWFDAAMPVAPNHREINESIHNRQIVIRKCVSLLRDEMNTVPQLGASWLRLQRLIGLIEDIGDGQVEQEKQEPVAWVTKQDSWFFNTAANGIGQFSHIQRDDYVLPLYAAPVSAKREWVYLTDDEIDELIRKWYSPDMGLLEFAWAVIVAFEDKNK